MVQVDLDEKGVYFQFYNPQKKGSSSLTMSRYISPFEEDNDGLKLGSDGTFSFRGFVGNSYLIKISATNIKGKKFSKQIEIKIDENLKFLEVILDTPEKD